jgi:hypothetical protein
LTEAELVDDGARNLAADAILATDAAVDMEYGHFLVLGIDLLPGHFK